MLDRRRRQFITLLGGAAGWPLAARAQRAGKLPTIGLLGASAASVQLPWTAAFVQRLRELGWIEDRTIEIDEGDLLVIFDSIARPLPVLPSIGRGNC
jgi:putative tryptophan/tyrosine transport system substrate-binding protein